MQMAKLGQGRAQYEWSGVAGETESPGFAHHGVAVTASGRIVSFDAANDEVVVFDADGMPLRRWASGLTEGHGITSVVDDDGECIWIADCGQKMRPAASGRYEPYTAGSHGRVVKFTVDGRLLRELPLPPVAVYRNHRYSPTAIAVDDVGARAGASGRIWVADGYGQSLVHIYDSDGSYLDSLDGSFNCPHGLLIDLRRTEPQVYIADRENGRLQVYSLDGEFIRTAGSGLLRRPSALATTNDLLIVAELEARVTVLDLQDMLVCYLGADNAAPERPGWPNALAADGRTIRPSLDAGCFNSPHGLAVDHRGNVVIAEWLIGGRLTKLFRDPT